jgi:hypothetical protein
MPELTPALTPGNLSPTVCGYFAPPVRSIVVMPPTRPAPEDQERLYPAIAHALLGSIPKDWEQILLRIEATGDPSGPVSLEISGPSGVSNQRVPDDSLYEPTIALHDLFARDARPFARCDFSLTWDRDRESWRFKAEYAYSAEAQPTNAVDQARG